MKRATIIFVLFTAGCLDTTGYVGEVPDNTDEDVVCNRDFECSEYPTWQSWGTYHDGDSEFACEPCWYNHHYEQRNDCCSCDPEIHPKWCSSGGGAIYFCSPLGSFVRRDCANYCAFFAYPFGDTCVEVNGEAQCDCRMTF